jgi:glutathione S-transferase
MKLFATHSSPFVRKVLVVAHELGLDRGIQWQANAAHPINRDASIVAHNPLGKIPTLIVDSGDVIFDSRVICEYLHGLVPNSRIFPADRRVALVDQALADGLLDAALLGRIETALRPPEKLWDAWVQALMDKVNSALDRFEEHAGGFGERIDIGTISIGCAVSYLDFRYDHVDWRGKRPSLAAWYARVRERPSFKATELH